MLLSNIIPHPSLRPFVRFYRLIHFDFRNSPLLPAVKAYRPRIEHCLQFTPLDAEEVSYPSGSRQSLREQTALFGQHTTLNNRNVGKNYLNVQIVFKPGILSQLAKISAAEITNTYLDGQLLLGRDLQHVNEQLFHAPDYPSMIRIVESYIAGLISKQKIQPHPVDHIADMMLDATNPQTIEWYAGQANLCFRQFDRMFKMRTGITPKDYLNLVRLDFAYLLKNRNPEDDWLKIAVHSGFYDYQHMSRAYRQYTGFSPVRFYELEKKAPERHFGDFEH